MSNPCPMKIPYWPLSFAFDNEATPSEAGVVIYLKEDFVYMQELGMGVRLMWIARAGMRTDGASIPKPLRPMVGDPVLAAYFPAAVLHDAYYRLDGHGRTRAETDAMFRDFMIDLGVSRWRAWMMWAAVRSFGWIPWSKKKGLNP